MLLKNYYLLSGPRNLRDICMCLNLCAFASLREIFCARVCGCDLVVNLFLSFLGAFAALREYFRLFHHV